LDRVREYDGCQGTSWRMQAVVGDYVPSNNTERDAIHYAVLIW